MRGLALRVRPLLRIMSTTSSQSARAIHSAIALSQTEEHFVRLLNDFATTCDPPVECRIAGGWVRDKLLSLPSSDLDIALSIPSGHAFAMAFVDYLHSLDIKVGSVGKVSANPEKSKHLETGTTTILGLSCDFVGLRSETYTDSRIPDQVKLGTPLEDALRRDLTINSLFFNVHNRQVEDWTGLGLADLAHLIARTPLPPRQTFFDDPLRVLRCVRFASRFNLSIDSEVQEAIRDEDIQAALQSKVSRERIGSETFKMLQKNPLRSIVLIDSLGLHSSIFSCSIDPIHPISDALSSAQILTHVLSNFGQSTDSLWLAAAVSPYRGGIVKAKKDEAAVAIIIAKSLMLSNNFKTSVSSLFDAATLLDPNLTGRAKIGTIMQLPAVRPWEQSLVWAAVSRILPTWQGSWGDKQQEILKSFMSFRRRIIELGLPSAIELPPLLNGSELQNLLDMHGSPILKEIKQSIIEWQLENPNMNKAECKDWVMGMWNGEGRQLWESKLPRSDRTGMGEKRKR